MSSTWQRDAVLLLWISVQVLSRLARGTGVITADIDLAKEAETRARFPALDNRQLGLPNVAAVLT